ncbi:hypothetical protein EYC84_001834 [Monilinia fructicola]|uniref:Uncharacterized protein n=1 Tax=Monilinia fructicola TaxID=38448 RepID=A0A5M9JTD7_MONFR|nr:hypothetical protein EYC84_001834 [Monilinia fructicola]
MILMPKPFIHPRFPKLESHSVCLLQNPRPPKPLSALKKSENHPSSLIPSSQPTFQISNHHSQSHVPICLSQPKRKVKNQSHAPKSK